MPHFADEESVVAALAACRTAPLPERAALEDQIVTFYLPLTRSLARRYRFKGVDPEDLEQVANLALVKAIRRFDAEAGTMRGYVTATVVGEIKKYFRDYAWCVRPPRQVQELQSQVLQAMDETHDDVPSRSRVETVARTLGVDCSLVTEVLLARGGFRSLSLDRPVVDGAPALADQISAGDDPYQEIEQRSLLSSICDDLDEGDKELLRLRYVEELSQRQIADLTQSTQKQVSRSLERILRTLRQRATLSDAA
jgi:RNA polymerase sigma-B factor